MQSIENIQNTIKENLAVIVYFSAPTCNVCHALKQKLLEALDDKEFLRKSRHMSVGEVIDEIRRPYEIMKS